jgi:hypothetical protein
MRANMVEVAVGGGADDGGADDMEDDEDEDQDDENVRVASAASATSSSASALESSSSASALSSSTEMIDEDAFAALIEWESWTPDARAELDADCRLLAGADADGVCGGGLGWSLRFWSILKLRKINRLGLSSTAAF